MQLARLIDLRSPFGTAARPTFVGLAIVALAPLVTAAARADSIGPTLGPIDRSSASEAPCDPAAPIGNASPLPGRYMCQIGLDGAWFQPYACDILGRARAVSGYLRYDKWNVPCAITGSVAGKRGTIDGVLSCTPTDLDVVSEDAFLVGRLAPIPGGFRFENKVKLTTVRAQGPEDVIPRATRITATRPTVAFNVCRRPWPQGFVSDIERAEAIERARRRP